uniref:Uncharacterized protein n=1 Tax=Corethron hystrix TaxID=216773 RepID=A0A7S1G1Y2_9STRA|mmetsp:Transcript_7100/g.15390  ORF Transcript_7100/g.15390 Transcript_7100/m.15390 type:complete len:343 (+) Transcript_7100:67-1095(+)
MKMKHVYRLFLAIISVSEHCINSFQEVSVAKRTPSSFFEKYESPSSTRKDLCSKAEPRRKFLTRTIFSLPFIAAILPEDASAGIDLSGISSGSASSSQNGILLEQLKAGGYDGSAGSRVQQIEQIKKEPSTSPVKTLQPKIEDEGNAAVNVFVDDVRMTNIGLGKLKTKFEGSIVFSGSKTRYLRTTFEFPSDWLQLEKAFGGIQFVDQRNGDKLYVLQARLPDDKTLADVPKAFFGEAIFGDQKGAIPRSGNVIDEFKVTYAKVTSDCPEGMCSTRRRALIKYSTVTGNGYRVERRALVDAFEVGTTALMMVTSSNANKFEAKGAERETVDAIVDSFRVEA